MSDCVTPRTVALQAPLSMGFSRQESWSGLPCPSPGDLPNPETEHLSLMSPALEGGFFTTSATWEGPMNLQVDVNKIWKNFSHYIFRCSFLPVLSISSPSRTAAACYCLIGRGHCNPFIKKKNFFLISALHFGKLILIFFKFEDSFFCYSQFSVKPIQKIFMSEIILF